MPEDERDTTGPAEDAHFIRPRTWAGLLIFALVAILFILDVFSVDYALDSIQLGLLLGTGGVLLGVEPLRRLLK